MENTGPSTANYKPNYKILHPKAGVCFSCRSLHRVTTQNIGTVKADLPKTPAVDSDADVVGFNSASYQVIMEHGVKILPKFQELPQISRREMCDEVPR